MKHYKLLYKLHSKKRYLIWVGDVKDSLVAGSDGFIPSFRDIRTLRKYAEQHTYLIEDERAILHDLDWVAKWLKAPNASIDCKAVLAFWNLSIDIAASFPKRKFEFTRLYKKPSKVYEKMFWGNNVPSMTQKGKSYEPIWSKEEIKCIGRQASEGCQTWGP